MEDPPSFSGPLKRKGAFFGIWTSCYCQIIGCDLILLRAETSDKIERRVKLRPQTEIRPIDETQPRFQVISPDEQPITFAASSTENMMEWILSLRAATFKYVSLTMNSFTIISVIGRGSYGKVMLCELTATKQLFAIKSVHKDRLIQSKRTHTILYERNILSNITHPFIVSLCFAFQTERKFYLGLEYVSGGELFHHFRDRSLLNIDSVRFYIAEIALALDHLHAHDIVYRDLKPENVLLGDDGYIKLTDFGLSKIVPNETSTFCGTPEYLAPEVIRREPYGFMIDWWALGILSYELLFGVTPFFSKNRSRMFSDIQSRDPQYPENTDPKIIGFVNGLLGKDPGQRSTLAQLRVDPFFGEISFTDLLEKKIAMTFLPTVTDEKTPTNFDQQFTSEVPLDSLGTPVSPTVDFDGFSFVVEEIGVALKERNAKAELPLEAGGVSEEETTAKLADCD
jgi:serine/threonine protein kinase